MGGEKEGETLLEKESQDLLPRNRWLWQGRKNLSCRDGKESSR